MVLFAKNLPSHFPLTCLNLVNFACVKMNYFIKYLFGFTSSNLNMHVNDSYSDEV